MPCLPKPLKDFGAAAKGMYLKHKGHEAHKVLRLKTLATFVPFVVRKMSEPKRPLKVFLCHAHADRDPVRALPEGARLTNDGVDAWLDREKLPMGCIIET